MRDLPNRTLSSEVGIQWLWPVTLGSDLEVSRTLNGRLRTRKFLARQVLRSGMVKHDSLDLRSVLHLAPKLMSRVQARGEAKGQNCRLAVRRAYQLAY